MNYKYNGLNRGLNRLSLEDLILSLQEIKPTISTYPPLNFHFKNQYSMSIFRSVKRTKKNMRVWEAAY